jgi:hypothetical protein
MFPIVMRLRIRPQGRRGLPLWLPVILVWLILWAVMIVLLPFMILGALVTWSRGPGLKLLFAYPLLFTLLWHLSGLHVETRNAANDVLISFE